MEVLIAIAVVSAIAGGGAAVYYSQRSPGNYRVKAVMQSIGMGAGRSEDETPFYRWGWNEEAANRVSAERMVRQAFRTENLWLNGEDLSFFRSQCERNISGQEVDEARIERKVLEIVRRSEFLAAWINRELHRMIEYVSNLSEAEVTAQLTKAGRTREEDREKPLAALMAVELGRFLGKIGKDILGPKGKGYMLTDSKGKVYVLQSMDAWKQVIVNFQEEALKITDSGKTTAGTGVLRSLKQSAENGILPSYLQDIEQARRFYKLMGDLIKQKQLNLSTERPRELDARFYKWKFAEWSSFKQKDHTLWREFLLRTDLCQRFREIIISKITEDPQCLNTIANLFYRNVIFFGGEPEARAYACDQYVRHLMGLFELVGRQVNIETQAPVIVIISPEEIENMRRSPRRGDKKLTLDILIEKMKKLTIMKESISEREASRRGWILNLGLSEVTSDEAEVLQSKQLKDYCRFNCDVADQFDLVNNTPQAKTSRLGYLNMMVDHLMDSRAISVGRKRPSFTSESS